MSGQIKNNIDHVEKEVEKKLDKTERSESTSFKVGKETPANSFQSSEMFTIPKPNDNFESLSIQAFKGLPRIGHLNTYDKNNRNLPNRSQILNKYKEERQAWPKYITLLEMKLRGNLYNEMDLEMPYEIKRKGHGNRQVFPGDPIWNTAACQINLLNIGSELTTDQANQKYFCNSNFKCKTSRGRSLNWGGLRANEFDKIECYKKFVKDNLQDLRSTANKITDEAYFVMPETFETYDFEQEGFPININLVITFSKSHFDPINDIGKKLHLEKNQRKLIKMPLEKGKELLKRNKRRKLYSVWKLKFHSITESEFLSNGKRPTKNFHLLSPVIELYEDDALTKKLAEITIE